MQINDLLLVNLILDIQKYFEKYLLSVEKKIPKFLTIFLYSIII